MKPLQTLILVLAAACSPAPSIAPAATFSATLILNATVLDGTGAAGRAASVRVEGDRIAAVGTMKPRSNDRIVDGSGLVLVPGFIDTHSHADDDIFTHRDALAAVSQGITTVVVGQDGSSPDALSAFFARLEQSPTAVNVASYVGHNTVREAVMGDDFRRRTTPDQIARGSGSFPKILGHYVRQRGILTLPEAVRKLSALAASHMGIRDRGRIAPGMQADLVLLDPKTVIDRATLEDPAAVSEGIRVVWVNGTVVYREGQATGAFPGRVIRR